MSEDEQFMQRVSKAEALRGDGHNPYANDFKPDTSVQNFVEKYHAEQRESLAAIEPKPVHRVAGRVMAINRFGKAAFIRIFDGTSDASASWDSEQSIGRLQVYVRLNDVGEETYNQLFKRLDIGDFVGVAGHPMRTKTDELSLYATEFRLLTKTLRPLPEKWSGLTDVETRYRQRYLDLVSNEQVRSVFRKRAHLMQFIRHFFGERGYLEVETPMMHALPTGAAARPFQTHHNALDAELYLRIAPELHLKRLVVGGFERVFELNRQFRNEGVSTMHNPEFTMLEFYQAYATYEEMMQIGEELLHGASMAVNGHANVKVGEETVSLKPPFRRWTMAEAIEASGGPSQDTIQNPKIVAEVLTKEGLTCSEHDDPGKLMLAAFEHFAEPKLIEPTFIYRFPASVSPLSRRNDEDPWFVDRFELFIGGHEYGNAFSELNDPVDQKQRFEAQLQEKQKGDEEAHPMDEDYVRALEHGMPPTAGFGIGIDRLTMLLTGSTSIRDVILFPLMRPKNESVSAPDEAS